MSPTLGIYMPLSSIEGTHSEMGKECSVMEMDVPLVHSGRNSLFLCASLGEAPKIKMREG